ncbi:hypothetical protein LCI18_005788 [Fusarium solani-melongenae]|uniref:Uncharacterized protein n=1 Tax=Fusarium solani subsp. cucurbitae TaxID=2747967 RepID=A0ACD3Z0S7_FUSSC|nr:hypothetical protein LCI18_005788 [Fusarium solani-melongenae]
MDPEVIEAVSAYLTDDASKPQARQALLNFTNVRRNHQPVDPLIPIEEYTARLDLIREIGNHQMRIDPGFDITRLQFCYLIRMAVSDLRRVIENCRYDPYMVKVDFECFVELTDYYLNPGEGSNTTSRSSVVSDTTKVRNGDQKDLCLALDKRVCIVTGASHPNVCHIIPCSSVHHRAFIKSLRPILAQYLGLPKDHTTYMMLDSLIELGSSDHVWNMICLSPTLHDWWG